MRARGKGVGSRFGGTAVGHVVQVDDDESEDDGHEDGVAVERDRLEDGLQVGALVHHVEQVEGEEEGRVRQAEHLRNDTDAGLYRCGII